MTPEKVHKILKVY